LPGPGGTVVPTPVKGSSTTTDPGVPKLLPKPIKDDAMPPPDAPKKGKESSKKPQPTPNDEDPESKALPMNEEHPESEGAK